MTQWYNKIYRIRFPLNLNDLSSLRTCLFPEIHLIRVGKLWQLWGGGSSKQGASLRVIELKLEGEGKPMK